MARKTSAEGTIRILDAWTPPKDAGAPVGCVATSYTFDSSFFEEECLGRFLQIVSDAEEDTILYQIEREEKLSAVSCASVLVDQGKAVGLRSPRWDLIPIRVQNGIMHAKVSLLHWQNLVRVIVSSANISEAGYRSNFEVVSVLDFHKEGELSVQRLLEVIGFLREVLASSGEASVDAPSAQRLRTFLDRLQENVGVFKADKANDEDGPARTRLVFQTPTSEQDALDQMKSHWPSTNSPPHDGFVVSPFYDAAEKSNEPALKLWTLLRQRGQASVTFTVRGFKDPSSRIVLYAPEALLTSQPKGRKEVDTNLQYCDGKADQESRPLHAKYVYIQNDRWELLLSGSSNFTSAGLGILSKNGRRNFEANVVSIVDFTDEDMAKRSDSIIQAMDRISEVEVDLEDPNTEISWEPKAIEEDEDGTADQRIPDFFASATLKASSDRKYTIELKFLNDLSEVWSIYADQDGKELIYSSDEWRRAGMPKTVSVNIPIDRPVTILRVQYGEKTFLWSVNIESSDTLLPAEQLRELTLDELIQVLVSARPLHETLKRLGKLKSGNANSNASNEILNPHGRVDTSTFLLQRTRRVSWALRAIREKLERPSPTIESLRWRLFGVVGVAAVANAIQREARSASERAFLLVELYAELSRVRYTEALGCVSRIEFEKELEVAKGTIKQEIETNCGSASVELANYITNVLKVKPA